jgi:hypothetical protein
MLGGSVSVDRFTSVRTAFSGTRENWRDEKRPETTPFFLASIVEEPPRCPDATVDRGLRALPPAPDRALRFCTSAPGTYTQQPPK